MKILVTGGAGCVGSNLVPALLDKGYEVLAYDNLYLGHKEFLNPYMRNAKFRFIEADILDFDRLKKETVGIDLVFHLAANSDISYGREKTDVDLQLGTLTTYNVLEAMRANGIPKIIFASTSAIYGEAKVNPTPEDYGPLLPISLYGASKLAAEGYISAFVHNFGIKAWIYRFGNVAGPNATHGILFDFIKRLRDDPTQLRILGDGNQAKPYIHVNEIISGMLYGFENATGDINVFNLTTQGATSVRKIASMVVGAMGLNDVTFNYTGGTRGWVGDVPQVRLDNSRMASLGWEPQLSSDEAVQTAIKQILERSA